jgi:hypothetical protein
MCSICVAIFTYINFKRICGIVTGGELHKEFVKGVLFCWPKELYHSHKQTDAIVMEVMDSPITTQVCMWHHTGSRKKQHVTYRDLNMIGFEVGITC